MSFEDIKGQDRAIALLKEDISRGRIFSSYLFVGPDGVGKSLTARTFAKAVNCSDGGKGVPCDTCAACAKINSGNHPDVFLVEPKGPSASIGIDEIRTVVTRAGFKPYEARKKVFIINEAHTMKAEAANAFLKTLEEPSADTLFILVSRSKELMLATIVSRCHVVRFFPAPPDLVEHLIGEKLGIGPDEARILANFSSGRIGKAIKMGEGRLIERKNRVIDGDFGAYSNREELKENMDFLIAFLRDILLYKTAGVKSRIFNVDRKDRLEFGCTEYSPERLDYLIKRTIELRSYVDYNVNPKIIVDVLTGEFNNKKE